MIEKIALRVFWTAVFICAALVISIVWNTPQPPEILFKAAATTFVIGLAAALVWVPLVTYRFYERLKK